MLYDPAALPLSRQTLDYTAGIIRHRKRIGSPWRKLNPGRRALLVLAYLRKGETSAEGFAGLGRQHRHRGWARLPGHRRHLNPHRPGALTGRSAPASTASTG